MINPVSFVPVPLFHVRPLLRHFNNLIPYSVQFRQEAKLKARWAGMGDRGAEEGK